MLSIARIFIERKGSKKDNVTENQSFSKILQISHHIWQEEASVREQGEDSVLHKWKEKVEGKEVAS